MREFEEYGTRFAIVFERLRRKRVVCSHSCKIFQYSVPRSNRFFFWPPRYDVSGVPADRIGRILERDWVHLVRVKGILDSPNYLHEKGRPVIGLWGT